MKFKVTNILFVLLILICPCFASDVLFVDSSLKPSVSGQQLELACRFYGLNVKHLMVRDEENGYQFPNILKWNDVHAIVITDRALAEVDLQALLPTLQKKGGKSEPLLIMGLTRKTNSSLLRNWSDGAVVGCKSSKEISFNGFYRLTDLKVLARQLTGIKIPFNGKRIDYFILDKTRGVQSIIQIGNNTEESLFPIFVKTMVDGQEVFFLTQNQLAKSSEVSSRQYDGDIFQILPLWKW